MTINKVQEHAGTSSHGISEAFINMIERHVDGAIHRKHDHISLDGHSMNEKEAAYLRLQGYTVQNRQHEWIISW